MQGKCSDNLNTDISLQQNMEQTIASLTIAKQSLNMSLNILIG